MNSSLKRTKTPGPRPRGGMLTTYRTDYKPFNQRSPQLYQLNPRPRPKPARPPVTPPKIDSDTWARYCRYHYKTTNDAYGSSTFAQEGQSLVVSMLERDSESQASGVDEKPPVCPTQTGQSCPLQDAPSQRPAAPSSSSTSCSSSSSVVPKSPCVSSLSPSRTLTPSSASATPSPVLSPTPTRPSTGSHREAWLSDAGSIKETMPVAKETVATAGRLPHIGNGEGSGEDLREQGEGPRGNSYEDFLQDLCRSAKLERLLNHHFASHSTLNNRGAMDLDSSTTTYRQCFGPQQDNSCKLRELQLPHPDMKHKQWRPWVTEYADKFGFLQRAFPLRTPRGTTLPMASSQPSVHYLVPSGKSLVTEYKASYGNKMPMSRPKTCPVYRQNRSW